MIGQRHLSMTDLYYAASKRRLADRVALAASKVLWLVVERRRREAQPKVIPPGPKYGRALALRDRR